MDAPPDGRIVAREINLSYRAKVEIIKILVSENLHVAEISRIVGEKYSTIFLWMQKNKIELPKKSGKRTPDSTRKKIKALLVETNFSIREISEIVGCSKHSVWLRAEELRKQSIKTAGNFQPVSIKSPRRCPIHGMVSVWPCVACQAKSAGLKPGTNSH